MGDVSYSAVTDVQSQLTTERAADTTHVDVERTLGERIRDARMARGLGVRELARLTECSASLVSQIERGRANPSVSTLYSLADALGISVASLFEATHNDAVVRSPGEPGGVAPIRQKAAVSLSASVAPFAAALAQLPAEEKPSTIEESVVLRHAQRRSINLERGVHWELLLPKPEREVDFLEVHYAPQGGSALEDHSIRHHGREMAVILEGTLYAQIGFEQFELRPGDSLSFASTTPHRYWNPGSTPARAIFVVLDGWEP
jgi:transcriptional regulator with XRE-family HTH domain/quercetin dioxygenase-like cupin family protein